MTAGAHRDPRLKFSQKGAIKHGNNNGNGNGNTVEPACKATGCKAEPACKAGNPSERIRFLLCMTKDVRRTNPVVRRCQSGLTVSRCGWTYQKEKGTEA